MGHWGSEKLSDFSEVPKQSENVTPGLNTKPLPKGFLLLHEISARGWIYMVTPSSSLTQDNSKYYAFPEALAVVPPFTALSSLKYGGQQLLS